MREFSRRDFVRASVAGTIGLAGCLTSDGGMGSDGEETTTTADETTTGGTDEPTWYTTSMTDVLSGEDFTIADLNADKPVIVETFAVWCSNCLRQQNEMITFHEEVGDDVTTVALNIDPNEDAEKVQQHAEKHGFDWRYAVSPSPVTESLVAAFGRSMTVAPQVPMVLVCPGGDATRLKDGHKSTDFLVSQVDSC